MTRSAVVVIGTAFMMLLGLVPASAEPNQAGKGKSRELPPPVAKAVAENKPGAEVDKLTIEKELGVTVYDFEFKANQGEMDVTPDGTVLDVATVIEMKELPDAVAAVIRKEAGKRAIKQLTRSEVRAEIVNEAGKGRVVKLTTPKYVYEAEFANSEIEVAADGTIIKKGK